MINPNDITLMYSYPNSIPQLENYYLSKDHKKYTGLPIEAIVLSEKEANRHPVIIAYHQVPVGFFVLHGWEGVRKYCNNRNALLLRTYSIDSRYQGQGIAKQSLKLLQAFVKEHFPYTNEIILAVNHMNIHAQHVYKRSGFVDKGIRVMGRKGEQFIFHMEIDKS